MDKAGSLLLVFTLVVFVSLPPLSSAGLPVGAAFNLGARYGRNFLKGFRSGSKWYHRYEDGKDILDMLGGGPSTGVEENAPSTLHDMYDSMFTVNFKVGNARYAPQQVTALFGISSALTWIDSQQVFYTNIVTCCNFKATTNDICCEECSATCRSNTQGYTLVKGDFLFGSTGLQGYFEMSNNSAISIGVLSFSRSPYSILRNFQTRRFSYFFSYNSKKNSSVLVGDNVILGNEQQSTQLLGKKNFPDLYFVDLVQISVHSNSVQIDPKSDLTYGVILDTIIPATLLAKPAYDKVEKAIKEWMGLPEGNPSTNGLELCYSSSANWPNLTLSFSSNSGDKANMVLTKQNYVVVNDSSNLECATILPTSSEGFSVIGTMAQLDRQMIILDDEQPPVLYFDQDPEVDLSTSNVDSHANSDSSASDGKPTIVLNMLAVFIIFLSRW